ncbi:hypothetical protein niasHS_008570 [Heterodera schachtii]|uniref:Uncharacterized protein n=1 Tax=Heterodera schachtii TaxID=97005 RepID=A0ABD2J361_HETSC
MSKTIKIAPYKNIRCEQTCNGAANEELENFMDTISDIVVGENITIDSANTNGETQEGEMDHAWRSNKNIILHDEFQNALALNMDAGNNNLEDENSESMVDHHSFANSVQNDGQQGAFRLPPIEIFVGGSLPEKTPRIGIIQGINNPAISSLDGCGGVKCISGLIYEENRTVPIVRENEPTFNEEIGPQDDNVSELSVCAAEKAATGGHLGHVQTVMSACRQTKVSE